MDQLLARLAKRCGKSIEANTPGAGAAGGLGFAMLAFFGATLRGGFDIVADAVHLRDRLAGADLCITGEGRLDASSLGGKASVGVARLCKELNIPCICIAGRVADEQAIDASGLFVDYTAIIDRAASPMDAMSRAAALIEDDSGTIIRRWKPAPFRESPD